ncbi:uncharacterized protein LOC124326112 isoform X2 [Daphnia pulicaria]|uniref:uncharacterized protein LOC124326112 isoform X2 n=1 Tax=Daphnia pulicaria TaxID=35523 RepID=UPI001EEAF78D|nr:uncharacterized protein LOC124326112 isoform X2 [Daphnia pulicaria]
MARTSIFKLAVVLFGLLTADASSEFDDEDLLSQLEDNPFEDFELRNYGNPQWWNGFCAGKRDGNYVNPADPHSFYQCHQNGVTLLRHCDPRTVYDPPPRDRCEWPHLVQGCNGRYGNCRNKEPIMVLPLPKTILLPILPPPPDYQRYGQCSNRPQCQSCKPPTVPYYQPRVSLHRSARETIQSQENVDESELDLRYSANSFCAGKKDGNYINPSNPFSLYQCHQNGKLYELPCQGGTVYDPPPADRCEWPNQVKGCNGGYGRGCVYAPIRVPVTTAPSPRQCNAICTPHVTQSPAHYINKYQQYGR